MRHVLLKAALSAAIISCGVIAANAAERPLMAQSAPIPRPVTPTPPRFADRNLSTPVIPLGTPMREPSVPTAPGMPGQPPAIGLSSSMPNG